MKIVVIGGSGLIGSKLVTKLRKLNHTVISGSPSSGINTVTGEGLPEALKDADVVVDLANSPSFEDKAVMDFFQTAGHNLLTAEKIAGVKHHVALSIVGADRMQNIGYMRAKIVQESLVKQSGVPYTIIRSTQFFEFLAGIANAASNGNTVHISNVQFQPIASEDVASFVAQSALADAVNRTIEIAGPERYVMSELVARYLQDTNDPRKVVPDNDSQYYGGQVDNDALVPLGKARIGTINFKKWLSGQAQLS